MSLRWRARLAGWLAQGSAGAHEIYVCWQRVCCVAAIRQRAQIRRYRNERPILAPDIGERSQPSDWLPKKREQIDCRLTCCARDCDCDCVVAGCRRARNPANEPASAKRRAAGDKPEARKLQSKRSLLRSSEPDELCRFSRRLAGPLYANRLCCLRALAGSCTLTVEHHSTTGQTHAFERYPIAHTLTV